MCRLASLNKKLFIILQKRRFRPILSTYVQLQNQFVQRSEKFSKSPSSVSWGNLLSTLLYSMSFQSSKGCGGLANLQVDFFKEPSF